MALDPNQNQLPQLPLDMDPALRNYLQALQDVVASQDIDDTPPSLVQNVTLNSVYPGILVSWSQTLKAHSYLVYRNTTGDFQTASPITQMVGNGNVSYFDVTQALGDVTLYYWVQGLNQLGIFGPVSAMVSTANSQAPGPGVIPGDIGASVMALAIPDDDLPQDFGTGFLTDAVNGDVTDSVTFWATTYHDEDEWVSNNLSTQRYALP